MQVRGQASQVMMMSSFIRLHVPQSIIQIVNVLNANSLVDFFSVCKKDRLRSGFIKAATEQTFFVSVKV